METMRHLNMTYSDEDFQKLKNAKEATKLSWERFFLKFVEKEVKKNG